MTCIVGLVDGGNIWIGGDSAGVGGLSLTIRSDAKVFRNGEFLCGFTSSFRLGQLLRYAFTPPEPRVNEDLMHYMVTGFIAAVRDCLKQGGFAKKDDEVESGGTFLVGYKGRLFKVDSDYQVGEAVIGFDACGCGEDIALGSLYSTVGQPARERVILALKAAQEFSAGVREPFVVECLEGGGGKDD